MVLEDAPQVVALTASLGKHAGALAQVDQTIGDGRARFQYK